MDRAAFERWVAMLRSDDDLTYEDGYACFMSYFEAVRDSPYVDDLIELALKETTAEMRYRFVEVLGLSRDSRALPHIQNELSHPDYNIRFTAYTTLKSEFRGNPLAEEMVAAFERDNPHEDFLEPGG